MRTSSSMASGCCKVMTVAVNEQVLRELRRARIDLNKITDVHTRELLKGATRAWNGLLPELERALINAARGTLTPAALRRDRRLAQALQLLQESLDTVARNAGAHAVGDLARVVQRASGAAEAMLSHQLPPGWGVEHVNAGQLNHIVRRSTEQITSRLRPIAAETHEIIGDELTRGIIRGQNPRQTAKLMADRALDDFNFGINRALVVARTETLDAYRGAAQVVEKANSDICEQWQWITSLAPTCCGSCVAKHGSIHPASEPGPLDHPLGRCARVPVTKSWKELGIDIPEPPALGVQNAQEWFDGLGRDDQLKVLGPGRLKAYEAGNYSMDKWSVRRENPGWRPSYQVSPVPK